MNEKIKLKQSVWFFVIVFPNTTTSFGRTHVRTDVLIFLQNFTMEKVLQEKYLVMIVWPFTTE